jgi:Domain of unknown function (DUF6458)
MRTASGLMLVALGAILAFAVKGHPSFLDIQIVGWVIMLTGVAGMVIPRRGNGFLRRRMVLRRGPRGRPIVGRVEETRYPPYVMLNPGTAPGTTVVADAAAETAATSERPTLADPAGADARIRHPDAERRAAERAEAEWKAAEQAASVTGGPPLAEEVVEEYVEE